jgi:integrase
MKTRLGVSDVKKLACPSDKSQAFLWDTTLPGFGVRCTRAGFKSYVVQRRIDGKDVRRTIGPHPEFSLDEAREEARLVLQGMRKGVDPSEVKREATRERQKQDALAVTLEQTADDYCANKKTKHVHLTERSKADIQRHIAHNFSDWADKPVRDITRAMCVKRFDEISKRAPSQCNQAFVLLRALLNWARDTHISDNGEYQILPVNPVNLMFKVRTRNPEQARTTRIPADKLVAVWSMLLRRRDPTCNTHSDCTSADLVALMYLTGMRLGEAQRVRWSDLNLEAAVPSLHIPVNKTHKPVTIPLATQLVELLRTRPRRKGNPYVFPARKEGSKDHAKDPRVMWGGTDPSEWGLVSRAAGLKLANHDLRRTYISAGQALGIELWRVELLTVHAPKSVTLQSYTETSDLRYLAAEQQRISDYITSKTITPVTNS